MANTFLFLGGISAAIAVALGGLRAHVLQGRLEPARLTMLDVGTRYHLMHAAVTVLVAALIESHWHTTWLALAGWGFTLGTLGFPCLLYVYAFTGRAICLRLSMIGGTLFIGGWVCLAMGAVM